MHLLQKHASQQQYLNQYIQQKKDSAPNDPDHNPCTTDNTLRQLPNKEKVGDNKNNF